MSKLGGSNFASGAAGAGINQLVMNELKNIKDPDVLQWASALVGGLAAQLVGNDSLTGASTAVSETRNNFFNHYYTVLWSLFIAHTDKIKGVIAQAEIEQEGTGAELYNLDFGDGDILRIKTGHGYRDDHRSQNEGTVPPFTATDKDTVIQAVTCAALTAYADHQQTGTSFPVLGESRPQTIYTNMFLFNPESGENEYTRIEIQVGYNMTAGAVEVSNFYPVLKL